MPTESLGYHLAYRFGITPWERYGRVAEQSIGALLDREVAERPEPPGRALDLGCGRGQKAVHLARRGWDVVGVDIVPRAIEAARDLVPGATFLVGDVTDLEAGDLGTFDFFLEAGCFQGLGPAERLAEGRGVTSLANPGATLLVLAFQPTRARSVLGGVTQAEVEEAFDGWELLSVELAETKGLGWPMNRTRPQWYRMRRH